MYFVIACKIIEIIGTGIISDRFNNMIAEGNGNITGIIKTVINNPAYIITQIMDKSKIAYILKTLGVLCSYHYVQESGADLFFLDLI